MALVFRLMYKDADDKPVIADDGGLGVRPGLDILVDAQGNARVTHHGMSVAPRWRDISIIRIPPKLVEGGRGDDDTYVFKRGDGAFVQEPFAAGLELLPDNKIPHKHGSVKPDRLCPLPTYRTNIEATRVEWEYVIDVDARNLP